MEKDNVEILKHEEHIEVDIIQLWQFLTKLCSTSMMLNNDYIKELLNLEDIDVIKDIHNYMNKFVSLPTSFSERLTNLIQLDLSNNNLKDLPYSLCLLKSLEHLALNNNQFSCLPSVVANLKSLKSLKVHNNYIKEISESIGNLENLEDLDLSYNKLTDIPFAYKKLHRLKCFSLAKNNFSKIPDCISAGMRNLEILDLSQNKYIILDIPLYSIHIKRLYARQNDICPAFPKWILTSKYYELEEVSLDYTVFKNFYFPNETSVSNIKKLSMVQCKLSQANLQNIIKRLKHIESINIGNNTQISKCNIFWFLPIQDIQDKSNLKEISAHRTGIPMIPKYINELVNLIMIDVSFNSINWLPDEICYLTNLQTLIINNNLLSYLPDSIGQLQSLKKLKANHNLLTRTPSSMIYLNNLKFLDLYNNEILSAREIIINLTCLQGMDLEQNYFSTTDLPITKSHYENLRCALLQHENGQSRALIGPKVEPIYDEEKSYCSSYSTRDSFDNVEVYESDDSPEFVEENWDDFDSADEFDPHECKEPTLQPSFSYCELALFRQRFCPADLHAKPIAECIARMINDGSLSWKTEFAEGQFDDV
ncbi:hypothetical protein KPH14_011695 [Odynerus spinipes]|uniref:Disease resistance R13L4/SHOC-2-like LRR domain-containing protein n=1 Tax=Odynerus spinipes TaxID=1348599 RepID=A0AAD9RVD5_9HYME|nr:hypothetical protein KPH14_011695 [Odynerus spinipes]